MQMAHSQYSFRSSLWSLHINEITKGDLECFRGKVQNWESSRKSNWLGFEGLLKWWIDHKEDSMEQEDSTE